MKEEEVRRDNECCRVAPPRNTRLGGYNSPLRGARQRLSSRRLSPRRIYGYVIDFGTGMCFVTMVPRFCSSAWSRPPMVPDGETEDGQRRARTGRDAGDRRPAARPAARPRTREDEQRRGTGGLTVI